MERTGKPLAYARHEQMEAQGVYLAPGSSIWFWVVDWARITWVFGLKVFPFFFPNKDHFAVPESSICYYSCRNRHKKLDIDLYI